MIPINRRELKLTLDQQVAKKEVSRKIADIAYVEILKAVDEANEKGYCHSSIPTLIYAERILGDKKSSLLANEHWAREFKFHDFWHFELTGKVSRWFPGIKIDSFNCLCGDDV